MDNLFVDKRRRKGKGSVIVVGRKLSTTGEITGALGTFAIFGEPRQSS